MAKKLTPKQSTFVREYLIDLNGTQAAIRAGYSERSANRIATEFLRETPHVAQAVQEAMENRAKRTEIDGERVLREIACMAFFDPAALAERPLSGPQDIPALPEEVRRAIVGWSWDRNGNFVLKLADKGRALEQYGRHLKLFTDVVEHKGLDELGERLARARARQQE